MSSGENLTINDSPIINSPLTSSPILSAPVSAPLTSSPSNVRHSSGLYHNGVKYEWGKAPTLITTAGIYHNPSLGLISLSSNGTNWITIADKNLGATVVYNDGDTLSESNCGKYFQRGNNYGFPFTGPTTTSSTTVNASTYGPGNYYSGSTFIINSSNYWDNSYNRNLWGGATDTKEARQGPCGNGFHIPGLSEWNDFSQIMQLLGRYDWSSFKNYLFLPQAGYIGNSGSISSQGSISMLFLSDYYPGVSPESLAYRIMIQEYQNINTGGGGKSSGYNIRPFKNTPVQPTTARTKLF